MPRSNKILSNMVGGEISPLMYGRIDAPIYQKALAKVENFISLPTGGSQYRNGTVFVTNTRLNQQATLYPFQFSDQQAYVIEATPLKFRFYTENGIVTGNDTLITGVTQATTAVVTSNGHGYANGDKVTINDVQGMVQLNGNTYTVSNVAANTYALTGINSTGYGAYTAKGKATQVVGISAITIAAVAHITAAHHQYITGDAVFISGSGMGIDGQQYLVVYIDANTFSLTDLFSNPISTIGSAAYTSGAIAQRIYEVTTPYVAADVPNIQYAQSADTLYMVNQNYAPQKLIRYAHANWTFGTFSRTGTDPFSSTGNYPRCVSFDSAARLWYGGTINNPQTIWGSSSPSSGNTAFDDFTFGTASTNAVQFTLAPLFAGKVDYLEWMSNTNQFMVLGTFASMRTMWGAAQGSPVTPTAVTLQPANVIGCAYTLPVANGDTLFFVQRGGQRIRSLEYDFYISGFTTKDQVLASDHLTIPGIQTIRQARGIPDVMWTTRIDGRFLGFTYSRPEIENYACWHRHYLGGRSLNSTSITVPFGFVSSIGVIARNNTADQIWFAVNRTINGNQVCSIEYLSDYQSYPNAHDFYTGDTINDSIRYNNALYETQKAAVYLDMANLYDGSSLGYNASVSVTPSAASGTAVTLASSAPIFTAAMVGQEIRKQYDLNGNGGGRFLITGFSNNQHVTGNITVDFDNTHAIGPGAWYLTATTLSGLNYLEGETVSVMVDGGPALDATVTNGRITLQSPAATAVVGYPYTGTLETLNIDSGGKLGTAQAKPRNLIRSAIRFLNSGGVQFGTDYYKLKQLAFRPANFQSDRPVALFTGIKMVQYQDEWSNQNTDPQKKVVVIQNLPLPCTVLGIDNFLQTTDE